MGKIRLYLDRDAYAPGETVRGRVEFDWPRARRVRGVRVALTGAEETVIRVSRGTGKNRRTHTYSETNPIVGEELILFGGPGVGTLKAMGEALTELFGSLDYPVLKAGRHKYPFEFALPPEALPSFEGTYATVSYRIDARVDVPAAVDMSFEGDVVVVPPRGLSIAPYKGKGRAAGGGLLKAFRADLDLDLRFDGCRLEPGARLEGRLLVRNRSGKKLRGATISLVGVEYAEAEGYEREDTFEVASGYLRAPDPAAPVQDVTFGIKLDPCPAPYAGRHSQVDLRLVAELDVALGFDAKVEIPLEIA